MSGKPIFVIRTYYERESAQTSKETPVKNDKPNQPTTNPFQHFQNNQQKPELKSHHLLQKQPSSENNATPNQSALNKPVNATKPTLEKPCPQQNGVNERENNRAPIKARQRNAPPPPPPLPTTDAVDSTAQLSIKLNQTAVGKIGNGSAVVSIRSPPTPPACPTPDYDTMSVTSEHSNGQSCINVNGHANKSKSSVLVNRKSPNADCVEMESLESFKLNNPSTVKPKPPSTYFAQNGCKTNTRSSDSSLTSRTSVNNVTIESAKPTITIREYPTTLERKNPSRFNFLNNNTPSSRSIVKDQPISSQLQNELTQTLSRANLRPKEEKVEVTSTTVPSNSNGKSVVTISVNSNKNQKPIQSIINENNGQQTPFYLHKNSEDSTSNSKISANFVNRANLNGIELNKSNLRCAPDSNKNTVTFNFGGNKKPEMKTSSYQQPNGILKNGTNGNISQVQIQNVQLGAANKLSQQKAIKFGGITTIIRNTPEPKA